MSKKINLVLEGGGVKGIALVGAIKAFEEDGYSFEFIAATSAGAIVGTLLAAGLTADELRTHMLNLDYKKIKDSKGIFKIPGIGLLLSLLVKKGRYDGDWFENYVREIICEKYQKPFVTFADLEPYNRLNLMVTDITDKMSYAFPENLPEVGLAAGTMELARAMRCSMSFPFFFKPVVITRELKDTDTLPEKSGRLNIRGRILKIDHLLMDGGMLSNFPWYYLNKSIPEANMYPTVGLLLDDEEKSKPITGFFSMLRAAFETLLSPLDRANLDTTWYKERVVKISVEVNGENIGTLDFDLDKEQQEGLFENGLAAGRKFLDQFKYEEALDDNSLFEADYERWSYAGNPFFEHNVVQEPLKKESRIRMPDIIQQPLPIMKLRSSEKAQIQLSPEYAQEQPVITDDLTDFQSGLDELSDALKGILNEELTLTTAELFWKQGQQLVSTIQVSDPTEAQSKLYLDRVESFWLSLLETIQNTENLGGKSRVINYASMIYSTLIDRVTPRIPLKKG